MVALACVALLGCGERNGAGPGVLTLAGKGGGGGQGGGGGGGAPPGDEGAGNCLSYPVIWAEGVTKALRGTELMVPLLAGAWWYQWGTNGVDPDVTPASCPPDPDEMAYCDDGLPGQFDANLVPGVPEADNSSPLARAYLQKDELNVWQAATVAATEQVTVDWIDWGDNLESVDWTAKSMVRTEVVLFEDAVDGDDETYVVWPLLEYEMRHTSGWGIDEVHGLATVAGVPQVVEATRATVYSHCARLTIQRLLVDRDEPALASLAWVPGVGWTGEDLINPPIFNKAVHEGGDGPGYYSAEVNVKGRVIYGYTWNVRRLHDEVDGDKGAGDYRLTFSLDATCGGSVIRNTQFVDGTTQLIVPIEEEGEAEPVVAAAEETGGATAVLRAELNLTYIDVRILAANNGGGKGGGGAGGGSPH